MGQLAFHTAAVPFVGFGMKALSTTIFEQAYGTSFLNSSYLTALSLVFLTVVRGIFPLFSRHLPLLQLLAGLMFFNTILYASFPMIVTYFSEWVMMGAKTLSVGSFAANHSMQLLLIMKLFGAAQCGQVQASLGVATAIGFGGGPVVGY